jgi:UTP--glucose-1-phosphate uridylyltransferase
MTAPADHVTAFAAKMRAHGLPPMVIDTFAHYYRRVVAGETGLIPDCTIGRVLPEEVRFNADPAACAAAGARLMNRSVQIVLNGGLGTSMGLQGPKSLLIAKQGQSFLQIILNHAAHCGIRVALMNSFSTDKPTRQAIKALNPADPPLIFLQHKFPKILQKDLSPATWPRQPDLEWNPPGHGDIFTALKTSGVLRQLLDQGVVYALICNCDNLGAVLDPCLLGYFAQKGAPFMMEVAEKTPSDIKGGHLARTLEGRLVLREAAQCPEQEIAAFQDIKRYGYFNTNNIWINLEALDALLKAQPILPLPMILNPKTLDPRDPNSPPVFQVETAMGAAISLFENAAALCVPRSRFLPVKKCNDLLVLRSDCFLLDDRGRLVPNPARSAPLPPRIDLDSRYYGFVDRFEERFPEGPPSLVDGTGLAVKGDVRFEAGVTIRGCVAIINPDPSQAVVKAGTVIDRDLDLAGR